MNMKDQITTLRIALAESGHPVDDYAIILTCEQESQLLREVADSKDFHFADIYCHRRLKGMMVVPQAHVDALLKSPLHDDFFNARAFVYSAIDGERDYQDAMQVGPGGRTDGRQKSVGDYLTLLRVYSAKADSAYSGNPGDQPALHEIRKIAAIAVQCLEVHGAPKR